MVIPKNFPLSLFLLSGLFLAPLLLPGFFSIPFPGLYGSDPNGQDLPLQQLLYDSYKQGIIPLWNPYNLAGEPLFAAPGMAPMYPPHFSLLLALGPVGMLKAKCLLHLAFTGVGMFLFLRQIAITRLFAFLAALTLQLSGHQATKAVFPAWHDSSAWLPFIAFVTIWFCRKPTLQRGMLFALAGGIMLQLFNPQITIAIVTFAFLFGAFYHIKFRTTKILARWPDWLLPCVEVLLIAQALRYPKPGATTGLGYPGVALLVIIWLVWVIRHKLGILLNVRRLAQWTAIFAGIFLLASMAATPQLATMMEMIQQSNMKSMKTSETQYFTGAMAYGCLQEFVEYSVLALQKDCVNNMALGPGVWTLVLLGIAGGFHRKHRIFLLFLAGAIFVMGVYLALPGFFTLMTHIPGFSKFPGMSRYLVFLNFFLIVLAALSAQLWMRRLKWKRSVATVFTVIFLANLLLLARHETVFWKSLQPPFVVPDQVTALLDKHLQPGERFLVDIRQQEDYIPLLVLGVRTRHSSIPGYEVMRLNGYENWLEAHNVSLGVNHGDYHNAFFEPAPTPWTQALRIKAFLMPPGNNPDLGWKQPPNLLGETEGWRLFAAPVLIPEVWGEDNVNRTPPSTIPTHDLSFSMGSISPHESHTRIINSPKPQWLVFSEPNYPGWRATVNGARAETATAYGFLRAVKIPAGKSEIHWEFRPLSFIFGWITFLWSTWIWIILFVAARTSGNRKKFFATAMLGLPLVVLIANQTLAGIPDALLLRVLEFALTITAALSASLLLLFLRKKTL